MYQIFKEQLEKSKLIISGVKRNQRLGREAGIEEGVLAKMEDDCRRLEALSAEMDKIQNEFRKKSDEAHAALDTLKRRTKTVKKAIKTKYDQNRQESHQDEIRPNLVDKIRHSRQEIIVFFHFSR